MFLLPRDLRVSDADREEVADFLKRHYAEGRLSDQELSGRVHAAYRARYESHLRALTYDLPPLPVPATPRRWAPRLTHVVVALALITVTVALVGALPAGSSILLFAIAVPMLMLLMVVLAPFVLMTLGVVWLARAIARPRRGRHVLPH